MNALFGDTTPAPQAFRNRALITIHTEHLDLKWSQCSNSANFLSEYFAGVVAETCSGVKIDDLTHSIAYLANELIENAFKFKARGDIVLEAGLNDDDFVLRISNWISTETSARFQVLLNEITHGDPAELLIERIEANASDDNSSGSGLGLLTLMNDYGVRFSWEFVPEAAGEERVFLKTLARLRVPHDKA